MFTARPRRRFWLDDRRRCSMRPRSLARPPGAGGAAIRRSAGAMPSCSDRADALAAGLVALGLEPGERIGIWSPNNAEWVLTQFATAKAGLMLVNVNPAYRLSRVRLCDEQGRLQGADSDRRLPGQRLYRVAADARAGTRQRGARPSRGGAASRSENRDPPGEREHRRRLQLRRPRRPGLARPARRTRGARKALQFDDPINIQFTSGTTGAPKGATLTHHNILNNGYFIGEAMRLTPADRSCIPVPFYHCFGMVMGNLACVTHGAAWSHPRKDSIRWRCSRRSRVSAARVSMACRPCSSRSSITPNSRASI